MSLRRREQGTTVLDKQEDTTPPFELDDNEVMGRYIDPKYIDIFVACKESELEEFEHSISDLEYNWYLHTV